MRAQDQEFPQNLAREFRTTHWTVPTDALSVLRLLSPDNGTSAIIVSWQNVSNRTYFLERASGLGAHPSFFLVTSNLVGQVGTTSYTNASGPSPFFYRMGIQQ